MAVSADGQSVYVTGGDQVFQYDVGADGRLSPKSPPSVAASATGELAVNPPLRVPTTKEQCKNGGWRNFPQVNNQGRCVALVERGPKG